jgi:phosphohistidine swiveling domain-containing protein
MASYLAAGRLLHGRATQDELQTLTRGLPHNPTTEMDLALWALTTKVRADPPSREAVLTRLPDDLARAYRDGALPPTLQTELTAFLARYGFRAVGEIDLGVPRWSEDPSHLLGAIANYFRLDDGAVAPDEQFRRGAHEAEAMIETLLGRVRGPRRRVLRFFLGRVRALMGSRELPKFMLIRTLFTPIRELLRPVGEELAAAGKVAAWDDVYFLTLTETREAIAGADLRELVGERRAAHVREQARRHIPRVMLSDGTDAEAALISVPEGAMRGSPASPGTVTAPARVLLSPHGARLEPGEILVAPSTDPGWTPLFLTAGGLVMEMGGMMSHGAVVAREYGIPAVVGVPGATEQIETGATITVDGSAGVVSIG